mgnify:CR=1 FL=1
MRVLDGVDGQAGHALPSLRLRGLMGMASYTDDVDAQRAQFAIGEVLLADRGVIAGFDRANLVTTIGGSHYFGALLLDDFVFELNAADPDSAAARILSLTGLAATLPITS